MRPMTRARRARRFHLNGKSGESQALKRARKALGLTQEDIDRYSAKMRERAQQGDQP